MKDPWAEFNRLADLEQKSAGARAVAERNGRPQLAYEDWSPPTDPPPSEWERQPGGGMLLTTDATKPTEPLFYTRDELALLQPVTPLIHRTLDLGTVFVIGGYYGTLKTFVLLSWKASLATGEPWLGREVRGDPRRCLYVIGEGAHGINARLNAWESWNGTSIPNEMFLTWRRPIDLSDVRSVREVAATVAGEGITVVSFDTLAKAMPGMDENSSKDMGVAVAAMYTVLGSMTAAGIVGAAHHTGKDRTTIRGSSALENGVDTVYLAEGTAENVTLKRTKRKDGPKNDELTLHFEDVPGTGSGTVQSSGNTVRNSPSEDKVLSEIFRMFSEDGASRSMIVSALEPMPKSTIYDALNSLSRKGKLANVGTGNRPHYRVVLTED